MKNEKLSDLIRMFNELTNSTGGLIKSNLGSSNIDQKAELMSTSFTEVVWHADVDDAIMMIYAEEALIGRELLIRMIIDQANREVDCLEGVLFNSVMMSSFLNLNDSHIEAMDIIRKNTIPAIEKMTAEYIKKISKFSPRNQLKSSVDIKNNIRIDFFNLLLQSVSVGDYDEANDIVSKYNFEINQDEFKTLFNCFNESKQSNPEGAKKFHAHLQKKFLSGTSTQDNNIASEIYYSDLNNEASMNNGLFFDQNNSAYSDIVELELDELITDNKGYLNILTNTKLKKNLSDILSSIKLDL